MHLPLSICRNENDGRSAHRRIMHYATKFMRGGTILWRDAHFGLGPGAAMLSE